MFSVHADNFIVTPPFCFVSRSCIHGDGSSRRHFLYVTDVSEAFDVIIHRGKVGEIYNIGSEHEISVRDLARLLVKRVRGGGGEGGGA